MDFSVYAGIAKTWLFTNGVRIVLILAVTLIAIKVARILSRRFVLSLQQRKDDVEFQKRAETLGSIINYIITVVIGLVAFIMLLAEVGIEIGPVLAAAGVVGLAVGFGAQSLVKDIITGFFILLENQIRVGDVVEIAGKAGLVERINLKMTVLRDLAGNVHFVPNGQIALVTNMTKDYSRYVFNVGVAYREDVDEVIKVIQEVDEDLRNDSEYTNDITAPIEILGLDQFADSAIIIKARTTTKPIQQWRVGREFNRRLKKRFDECGIEIPFPHVTLYLGQDKEGSAPPMNVVVEKSEEKLTSMNKND